MIDGLNVWVKHLQDDVVRWKYGNYDRRFSKIKRWGWEKLAT